MMRHSILVVSLILSLSPFVHAEDEDLQQSINDLSGQTDDKQRLDTQGAVKVELNEVRTWLGQATNAVKEGQEKKCRRIFQLVREQLKLIDQLIELSKLEARARALEDKNAKAQQEVNAAKQLLEEKQAKLKAYKLNAQ